MEQQEGWPTTKTHSPRSPASASAVAVAVVVDDGDLPLLSSAIFLSPMSSSMSLGPRALANPKSTRVIRVRLAMSDTFPSTSSSSLYHRSSSIIAPTPPDTMMLAGWISLCMTDII